MEPVGIVTEGAVDADVDGLVGTPFDGSFVGRESPLDAEAVNAAPRVAARPLGAAAAGALDAPGAAGGAGGGKRIEAGAVVEGGVSMAGAGMFVAGATLGGVETVGAGAETGTSATDACC